MDMLDIFVKITNLKINLRNIAKDYHFEQINNVFYRKEISEDVYLNLVFDEDYYEIWVYFEELEDVKIQKVKYENILKDMIFYELTEEELFRKYMNKAIALEG